MGYTYGYNCSRHYMNISYSVFERRKWLPKHKIHRSFFSYIKATYNHSHSFISIVPLKRYPTTLDYHVKGPNRCSLTSQPTDFAAAEAQMGLMSQQALSSQHLAALVPSPFSQRQLSSSLHNAIVSWRQQWHCWCFKPSCYWDNGGGAIYGGGEREGENEWALFKWKGEDVS